jgi:flagellar protein FlaG
MADQVNPIGSLTPGPTPVAAAAASAAQAAAPAPRPRVPSRVEASSPSGDPTPVGGASPSKTERAANLEEATKSLQAYLKGLPSDLQFRQDEDSGKAFFKVVNPVTREVIRQVPSEEVLAMARKLKELDQLGNKAPGLLLDHEG